MEGIVLLLALAFGGYVVFKKADELRKSGPPRADVPGSPVPEGVKPDVRATVDPFTLQEPARMPPGWGKAPAPKAKDPNAPDVMAPSLVYDYVAALRGVGTNDSMQAEKQQALLAEASANDAKREAMRKDDAASILKDDRAAVAGKGTDVTVKTTDAETEYVQKKMAALRAKGA